MASIEIKELIRIIESDPEYRKKMDTETPPSKALYIDFGENKFSNDLVTEDYLGADGSLIVVDIGTKSDSVLGIELIFEK